MMEVVTAIEMRLLDTEFMKSLAEPSYAPKNLLLLSDGAAK